MAVHPRMRGERVYWGCAGNSDWFIPACAGNATNHRIGNIHVAVHPRMRGERRNHIRVYWAMPVHPRMRGERIKRQRRVPKRSRFIPACAGNAIPQYISARLMRFIPACAGNALCLSGAVQRLPVHPRMRGERVLAPPLLTQMDGSSPHARGTRNDRFKLDVVDQFIPACAGNAKTWRWCWSSMPVHPRMRGERESMIARLDCIHRFIPACAGNALQGKPLKRQTIYRVKQTYRCSGFVHCGV